MLIGIDPILSPELLHILRAMGHGEELAIVDRAFNAISAGPTIIRQTGDSVPRILEAVVSVLPLEKDSPALIRMEVTGHPDEITPVMADMLAVADRLDPRPSVGSLTPTKFKERVAEAVAIVVTGEARLFGNVLVRKGTLHG